MSIQTPGAGETAVCDVCGDLIITGRLCAKHLAREREEPPTTGGGVRR